jgi:CRISPR-associated endoribonuclease Cas6
MPHSLVFNLTPKSTIQPEHLTGKHLHALWLTLISHIDRDLGNTFHSDTASKPFTLSPLQIHDRPIACNYRNPIKPGTPCWWRVTLLDETLFSRLMPLWLNLNADRIWHLDAAELTISSVFGTTQSGHPWASACTYAELYALSSDRDRDVTLEFATPTTFRQGKYDTALPTPESVFRGVLKKWNCYSEIEILPEVLEVLSPQKFELKTRYMAVGYSKILGAVGQITYKIVGEVEPIVIQQLNSLANYTLYAGVGRKTTMGLGMTRRLMS